MSILITNFKDRRDYLTQYARAWRKKNIEKYLSCASHWRDANREKVRATQKRYRLKKLSKDPRFYADASAKWKFSNPQRAAQQNKKWKRKRYTNDPAFRFKQIMSGVIAKAVKKNDCLRSARTEALLGMKIKDFVKKFELMFKPGMRWDNHGRFGWHIDHIRPCSSFDLSNSEEQKKCFHHSNLQPLWWRENLSKGAKCIALPI